MRAIGVCLLLGLGIPWNAQAAPGAPKSAKARGGAAPYAALAASSPEGEPLSLLTPLDDRFSVEKVTGSEELSHPYSYEIAAVVGNRAFKAEKLLGRAVSLRIRASNGSSSYISGLVSEIDLVEIDQEGTHCHLTIVPWFEPLHNVAGFDIFQNLSVPEIMKRMFQRYTYAKYEMHLARTYPVMPTAVQYRETDRNFIDRSLEDAGIAYYFRQEKDRQVMVLADSAEGYRPFRSRDTMRYRTDEQDEGDQADDGLSDWQRTEKIVTTAYQLSDHNFELSGQAPLTATSSRPKRAAIPELFIHDAPGKFSDQAEAAWYARLRLEEDEASAVVVEASAKSPELRAGTTFKLTNHPGADQNGAYLVTKSTLAMSLRDREHDGQTVKELVCENQITAIPLSRTFRPSRTTAVPDINGVQTAIVVGPKANEVHTDAFGRIQVRFFWDLRKPAQQNAAWVRVMQPIAAGLPQAMSVPRVGQEVVVTFLEGDADRPLVIGLVYNADQTSVADWPRAASAPAKK